MAQVPHDGHLNHVRMADALARFYNVSAPASPQALIGEAAHAAWFDAARRSETDRRKRFAIYAFSGLLIIVAIGLALQPWPAIVALVPAIPAAWLIGRTMRLSYRSSEPKFEALIAQATPEQRDRILGLDEFCRRAASGKFGVVGRSPDGTLREFSPELLTCFVADGGKLLVLSDDPEHWQLIRRRPVPRGEILIDIRGAVASTELTSKFLISMADEEAFQQKFEWLLAHARADSREARAFRHSLNAIAAFRRPEIMAITNVREKIHAVEALGFGDSHLTKLHAGSYDAFDNFLRTLPLNEIP